MKNLELLKQEQYSLKVKLHEIVDLINSKEYFTLSPKEQQLITQQRGGMEIYLNALTNRIYNKDEYSFDCSSAMFIPLLSSMFTSAAWGSTSNIDSLKAKLEESEVIKKKENE